MSDSFLLSERQMARITPHLRGAGRGGSQVERIMIDATHLKAHHGGKLAQKGDVPRRIGRTKGGLNSKLHTVCDDEGRPIIMLLSEGQMSDHKGAHLILDALPPARTLIGDRGYDSNAFREVLQKRGC